MTLKSLHVLFYHGRIAFTEKFLQALGAGLAAVDFSASIQASAVEVAKRNELHNFIVISKRWVLGG
jgi:hypothetical protein